MVTLATCFVATVTPVVAITLPLWALTVVVPNEAPVSSPPLEMLAILDWLVLQMTLLVTSLVELSPKVAVAEYCCVTLGATVALSGATDNEVIVFPEGKNCPQPMPVASKPITRAVAKT